MPGNRKGRRIREIDVPTNTKGACCDEEDGYTRDAGNIMMEVEFVRVSCETAADG